VYTYSLVLGALRKTAASHFEQEIKLIFCKMLEDSRLDKQKFYAHFSQ